MKAKPSRLISELSDFLTRGAKLLLPQKHLGLGGEGVQGGPGLVCVHRGGLRARGAPGTGSCERKAGPPWDKRRYKEAGRGSLRTQVSAEGKAAPPTLAPPASILGQFRFSGHCRSCWERHTLNALNFCVPSWHFAAGSFRPGFILDWHSPYTHTPRSGWCRISLPRKTQRLALGRESPLPWQKGLEGALECLWCGWSERLLFL